MLFFFFEMNDEVKVLAQVALYKNFRIIMTLAELHQDLGKRHHKVSVKSCSENTIPKSIYGW